MNERRTLHPWAQEGGQTLVEFALSLMVLLLLVFGLIDFSRAVYAASVVQWAAQQGARTGVAGWPDVSNPPTAADVSELNALKAAVEADVSARLDSMGLAGAIALATPQPGTNLLAVDVTYHFEFIVPIIVDLFTDGIDLQASASMVAH